MKYKFDIGDLIYHRHNQTLGIIMKRHAAHGYNELYNRYEIKWLSENPLATWKCDFEYELKFLEEQ